MKIRVAILVAMVFACTSCGSRPEDRASLDAGMSDAAAVAVFRELIRLAPSDPGHVYCLQIDGSDPPAAVVASMGGSGSTVVPVSACSIGFKRQVHTTSGRPAIVHYIKDFVRYGSTSADADAGIVIHGLNATHYHVELRYESGKWRVERMQVIGIS